MLVLLGREALRKGLCVVFQGIKVVLVPSRNPSHQI